MHRFLLILCLIFFFPPADAITPASIYEDTTHQIQYVLHPSKIEDTIQVIDIPNIHSSKSILSSLTKIASPFHPPKQLYSTINFWYFVFNSLSFEAFVIHTKEKGARVFKAYDFSTIHEQIADPFLSNYIQNLFAYSFVYKLRKSLPKKQRFNLRIQTGQREIYLNAFKAYQKYAPTMDYFFKLLKAPKEFLALPFLESHFNFSAISRSGAYGLWQFMKPIAHFFMPSHEDIDYRLSPYLSTIAAIHLLKQNKMILKKWDLAILAYNTGVTEVRQERKHLPKLSLEALIKRSKNPHFGFAAKNYYSEFYAILMLLNQYDTSQSFSLGSKIYLPYITTCAYSGAIDYDHNAHLQPHKNKIPAQQILFIANKDIAYSKCLKKVSQKEMKRVYPKNWL